MNLPVWATQAGLVLLLVAASYAAYLVTVRVLRSGIRRIASRTTAKWDDRIIQRKVFERLSNAVPAAVIYFGIAPALGLVPGSFTAEDGQLALAALVVQRMALVVIVLAAALAVNGLLNAINDIYTESYEEANNRPIKGYLQVVGLVVYLGIGIVIFSIVFDRSPMLFLSGLGAITAVLLLVFRDTILSLVASLQIMSNDMIRIGDWVEMPQNNADGDVIDIALHTVKIQNWDKTITTVPTHKFISESFKNWRGMSEAGGRRIKRALQLDLSTVRFLTEEEIERLGRHELLREYVRDKRAELAAYAEKKKAGQTDTIPEIRRMTNVGTFRAYVARYLDQHPVIHDGMTQLVRQLAPSAKGLPIEIYCFTNDTAWATYERVQGDIFDHLIAILPEFGLKAFQEPTGSDLGRLTASAAETEDTVDRGGPEPL